MCIRVYILSLYIISALAFSCSVRVFFCSYQSIYNLLSKYIQSPIKVYTICYQSIYNLRPYCLVFGPCVCVCPSLSDTRWRRTSFSTGHSKNVTWTGRRPVSGSLFFSYWSLRKRYFWEWERPVSSSPLFVAGVAHLKKKKSPVSSEGKGGGGGLLFC